MVLRTERLREYSLSEAVTYDTGNCVAEFLFWWVFFPPCQRSLENQPLGVDSDRERSNAAMS
jgi:hypothetical protein